MITAKITKKLKTQTFSPQAKTLKNTFFYK